MAIRIVVCKESAFVWNPKDVRVLREDHRIVGGLVGAHPRAPYQNSHLSLPLKLMPEETTLLMEKGLANLVDGEFRADPPSEKLRAQYDQYKRDQYREQNAIFQRDRLENQQKFARKIAEGSEKRRKRAQLKTAEVAPSGADSEKVAPSDADSVEAVPSSDDSVDAKPMAEEYVMVQLFHEEPWRPSTKPATWSYPRTEAERLRYAVYRDLWERGYYLTSGGKFGGDFLVYPGDPLLYHSFHIAVCLPDDHRLDARQLVSMGRLGSNVRKTLLICSQGQGQTHGQGHSEDQGRTQGQSERSEGQSDDAPLSDTTVHYLTLEWTGIN